MKLKLVFTVLAFIAIAFFLTGCNCGKNQSVVSVSGTGTVMVQPDTVQMQISLNRTARTTRQAQEEVNVMVKQALQILEAAGIESRNISTAALRFNPEYDWSSSRRILLGQRAEQVISFSIGINNSETETNRVSNIIDRLIEIDGIELQQTNFNVKNTDGLFVRARELAYQKALEKAEQYAKLSGMKIIRTASIAEEGTLPVSPVYNRALNNRMVAHTEAAMDSSAGSTVLPTGELEITSRILVEFLLR